MHNNINNSLKPSTNPYTMLLPRPSSPLLSLFFLVCNLFLLIVVSMSTEQQLQNIKIPAIIVFGDSIVDQGNNNLIVTVTKANFPPYGKDFAGGVPTGRFSNGKTPADILAESFGIKEFVPAYLDPHLKDTDLVTGVSFATGGTGFDPETSQTVFVPSMSDQLKMFIEYIGKLQGIVGEDGTKYILNNSLFVIIGGSDDIANNYYSIGTRRLHYDINTYTDLLVQEASKFLQKLYELGARRIALHGLPPIGCVPSQRTVAGGIMRNCADNQNEAAKLLNNKLMAAVNLLQRNLGDAKVRMFYVDIYQPLLDLIVNHNNYGFDVADKGCCGTGTVEVIVLCNKFSKTCPDTSVYVFWDSYHLTESGYKSLIEKTLPTFMKNLQK